MRPEITFDICGRRVTLAFPLGAWEELAKAGHDKPLVLERAFREESWSTKQMIDTLGIALKHGGSGLGVSEVVAAHGLLDSAVWAHAAILRGLVFEGEKKKDIAPKKSSRSG